MRQKKALVVEKMIVEGPRTRGTDTLFISFACSFDITSSKQDAPQKPLSKGMWSLWLLLTGMYYVHYLLRALFFGIYGEVFAS